MARKEVKTERKTFTKEGQRPITTALRREQITLLTKGWVEAKKPASTPSAGGDKANEADAPKPTGGAKATGK